MSDSVLQPDELEALLRDAGQKLPELPEIKPDAEATDPFSPLAGDHFSEVFRRQLEAMGDIELEVCIELGQTRMRLQDVALLRRGSVVVLDRHVNEPVNVLVNGRCVARGKLLVVDGRFAVQLVEFI